MWARELGFAVFYGAIVLKIYRCNANIMKCLKRLPLQKSDRVPCAEGASCLREGEGHAQVLVWLGTRYCHWPSRVDAHHNAGQVGR